MTDFGFLDDLDLPPLLPGEEVETSRPSDRVLYYDPDGRPIKGSSEGASHLYVQFRRDPDNHFVDLGSWQGRELRISTVYLGINHQFFEGPPLVWETMIFSNGDWAEDWMRRYTTRAAAHSAHLKIVAALVANRKTSR